MSLPDKIGPYSVVRKLGEGGMGVVYEVLDPLLGRPLALKVLLRAGDSTKAHDRFWREAEALGKVQHPGIVKVHLTGRSPQGPYLVQELLQGEPLDRVLERGPLAPRRAAEVVRDLAEALAAVHAQGLLHRDLKPGNVIVRDDGRPVLIDFGLAWDAEAEHLTKTGAPLGTPAYMPPEQARGMRSSELDPRCDVYGLGAILYECLTGAPPFTGDTAFHLFAQVLHEEPVWPADAWPGVPSDLDAICRRAMAKAREERHPSASALRDELVRFLAGEPLEAGARVSSVGSALTAFARGVRRRWGRVALLVFALLVAGAGLGVFVERRAQERARQVDAAQADLDALASSLGGDPSPRLLEQVERALAHADELLLASSDDPGARRLAAGSEAIRAQRDRALFLRAAKGLERAPAAPDLAAIESALDAAARVAIASPPDAEVEEARGRACLLAQVATDARDALARAVSVEPTPRRLSSLAWAELAAGDAVAAEARLAHASPLERARLLAAAAALAPDETAADARARALALLSPEPPDHDHDAALVAASLSVDALRRRRDAPTSDRLDVLLAVRALSLPSSRGRVPHAVQAEACLLEGAVLLELGWWLSAAEAYSRHARIAGSEPPPSALVPVLSGHGRPALVAPDLAARVGEARARSRWFDESAALAARAVVLVRARRHSALGFGVTSFEPVPGMRLADEGWAELAVARAGSTEARARARRAFELALGAADEASARAGLAQVEALSRQLDAASRELARARGVAPDAWATRETEVSFLLAAGPTDRVLPSLVLALATLDASTLRPLERTQRAIGLLQRAHETLRRAGCDVDALGVLDLLSRRADADRLPVSLRKRTHERLRDAATKLDRPELVSAALERLAAVEALERRLAKPRKQMERARRTSDGLTDVRGGTEMQRLLSESPLEAVIYINNHNLGARLRAGGFDSVAIACELDPAEAITYVNLFSPRTVAADAVATTGAAIAALAEPGEPDPELPHARDDALRLALGALYALDSQVPLSPATLRACHAAALDLFHRRPETLAAALLLGRLQVGIGDFAGALSTLARAERLPRPLSIDDGASSGAVAWSLLYRAMAHGGLRQWDDARRCLDRLTQLPAAQRLAIRGYRVLDEPLLWEDRDLPGTLPTWARDLARTLGR